MFLTDDLRTLIAEVTGQEVVETVAVRGAGGGGGKGGGGSNSTTPDNLFSTATIKLVDLLGEGEIVGVKGGLKGVYLNEIPVQNQDGTFNFKGITAEFRNGTPDQSYLTGYPDVQTPHSVGTEVKQATPVVASISETDATRVRVTLQFPALFVAKNDGSVSNATCQYRIEARYSGGPWVNQLGDRVVTGKTSSGYYRSHDVDLPVNSNGASAPWQVRVTKISPDDDPFNQSQNKYTRQSSLIFSSTTSIVDAKFSYPNSALVGITASASLFGSSVPGRTYLVDGVKMAVPSNYDPAARTYSGMWDGTFKTVGGCRNPAWAMYLILSSNRFGLGDYIDVTSIDKATLYDVGRYCDVLVPDGKGGQECRFSFNGVISSQQEAFELLQLMSQVFQGYTYWSSGTVTAAQDRATDPVLLVTEANVIDGEISYSSSSRRARHTVAIVAWNDPTNLYKQEFEVVGGDEIDPTVIGRYGYNPKRIDILGCTSRGQAHRAGLWALFTELKQTQIVTYKAGLDHAVARPGDVVAVQDPQIAAVDVSGRLLAGSSASNILLDRPVTLVGANTYTVSVVMPDGTVGQGTVAAGTSGTLTALPLSSALPAAPDPAAVWVLAGPVKPQQFRIVSIREEEPHIYSVVAIQHEPGKYATVDNGATFEAQTYSLFPVTVAPPANLSVRESQYTDLGQPKQDLTLSWTPGDALSASGYYVTATRPSGAIVNVSRSASTSVDFRDVEPGVWTFFVTAYGVNGKTSTTTQYSYTVVGWAGQAPTTVANLSLAGGGTTFGGRSCTVQWTNVIDPATSPYPVRNVVRVYDISTSALLHTEYLAVGQIAWTYDYQVNVNEGGPRRQFRIAVTALSPNGNEGPPTSASFSNPAPAVITPTLQATSENIFVTLPSVTDQDFAGYLVWVSTTTGFTPTDANVSADGVSTLQSFRGTNGTTYYVRAAAYDAFSKAAAGLNISQEYPITCTGTAFDTTAPASPAGLNVAANTVDVGPDGTITSKVQVSWTAVTSANLGKYEVAFALGNNPADSAYIGGNFVSTATITRQGFVPGQTYSVKVRSISQNGFGISGWSPVLTFTAALNTAAPGPVTNLAVVAAVKTAFLSWTNPTDKDFFYVKVYAGSSNVLANATELATVSAPTSNFVDSNLPDSGTRYYWVRAFNSSGVGSASTVGPVSAMPAALTGSLIAANTIAGDRLLAESITSREVKTQSLTADRMAVGVLTADTITVGSGGALSSVLGGTSVVKIAGGAISANSISAAQIRVNSRGVSTRGISFNMQRDGAGAFTNTVIWSAGFVSYTDNTGASVEQAISAGSAATGGTQLWVYWTLGSGSFSTTTSWATANGADNVVMAGSSANNDVQVFYGGIVLDGTKISALSIATAQLQASAITADKIAASTITGDKIAANTITGDKVQANTITAKHIYLSDSSNVLSNGDFLDGTSFGWVLNGDSYVEGGSAQEPGGLYRVRSGNSTQPANTLMYTCRPGDVLYGSSVIYNAKTSGTAGGFFNFFDGVGGYISTAFLPLTSVKNTWLLVEGQITVPTGAQKFYYGMYTDTASGGLLYFGKSQVRRASGASLIVDGSITANKLTIGTSTGNLLANSDCLGGTANYEATNGTLYWAGYSSAFAPAGMSYLYNASTAAINGYSWLKFYNWNTDGTKNYQIPVLPNTRYECSSYFSSAGGPCYIEVQFYDSGGSLITTSGTNLVTSNGSGKSLTFWPRTGAFVTTPAGTCYVNILFITYHSAQANTTNSWTGMYFGKALPNQSVLSDWIANSQTVISGGQVTAYSITADRMNVGSLSAITANVGTLTAGVLQSADGKTVFNLTNGNLTISD